ncbi:hypothetical protein E4K10_41015 [Streptomyces sp. T1317-0309]|nr:hypothetical protein E4K10_41015 [Streptomyces sp. T1317-0309]
MGGVTDQSVANAVDKPFLMPVEDVFSLHQGRLVMVTGRIERGSVRQGDAVEIVGFDGNVTHIVAGIEQSRVPIEAATAELNVGVLLPGSAMGAASRGRVLTEPGSISAQVGFTPPTSRCCPRSRAAWRSSPAITSFSTPGPPPCWAPSRCPRASTWSGRFTEPRWRSCSKRLSRWRKANL